MPPGSLYFDPYLRLLFVLGLSQDQIIIFEGKQLEPDDKQLMAFPKLKMHLLHEERQDTLNMVMTSASLKHKCRRIQLHLNHAKHIVRPPSLTRPETESDRRYACVLGCYILLKQTRRFIRDLC